MELREIHQIVSRVGLGEQMVKLYDAIGGGYGVSDELVADEVRDTKVTDPEGYILFPIVQGRGPHTIKHCVMAHAFRLRGYKPIFLFCDAALGLCHKKEGPADTGACERCHYYSQSVIKAFGLDNEVVWLDRQYRPQENLRSGVDIEKYAVASARAYLQKYSIGETDRENSIIESFVSTAYSIASKVEAILDDHDVVCVMSNDGSYVYGGLPIAVAGERGIPSYSYGKGFIEGNFMFGSYYDGFCSAVRPKRETAREAVRQPLTEEQRRAIEEFMRQRMKGVGSRHRYSAATGMSVEDTQGSLVGMFTNLIWDGSLQPNGGVFDDVLEWVTHTVDLFRDREDVTLVVKTHPAEKVRGTNEPVGDWIRSQFASLPGIEIVGPDSDIDTYSLMDDLTAGIVYNSTVGLEMAYAGIPVVTGGQTHYRGLGITHDPVDVDEYNELVENVTDLESDEGMRERARRYSHLFFVDMQVEFPEINDNKANDSGMRITNDLVAPGKKSVDQIVSSVVNGEDVLCPE